MSLLSIQASGVLPSTFSNNLSSEAVRVIITISLILYFKVGDKKNVSFFLNQHLVSYTCCVREINHLQVIAVFEIIFKQLTSTQ